MDPLAIDLLEPGRSFEGRFQVALPEGGQRTIDDAFGRQVRRPVSRLAHHILMLYGEAREAKETVIEPVILQAARVRNGEFDADFLAELNDKNIEPLYVPVLDNKCVAAAGMQRTAFMEGGKVAFGADPTPIPSVPAALHQLVEERAEEFVIRQVTELGGGPASPAMVENIVAWAKEVVRRELMREAKDRVKRAQDLMGDMFEEGGFYRAMFKFFDDLATYPAAFVKGPIPVRKWVRTFNQAGGFDYENRIVEQWRNVHPKYIYPEPGAEGIEDGYLVERGHMSRREVEELIGVPGVDGDAIRSLLAQRDESFVDYDFGVDDALDRLERKGWIRTRDQAPGAFDSLIFYGDVSGRLLRESGVDAPAEGTSPVIVKTVGDTVVKCLIDSDPRGHKPLAKASYFDVPHAFWGKGIPEKCFDIQRSYHATLRAMSHNMSIASGPQVTVWQDAIGAEDDITALYPWKVWLLRGEAGTWRQGQGSGARPIDFFSPETNAHLLIAVAAWYEEMMDKHTGVASYDTGETNVHGAGRTMGGLRAIMDRGSTIQRSVADNVDMGVVKVMVERLYDYILKHALLKPEDVGDVRIRGLGAKALDQKNQIAVRGMEFLTAVGSNPEMMALVGQERMLGMLRKAAAMVGLDWEDDDTDEIVPGFAEVRAVAGLMPPPGADGAPMGQLPPPGGSMTGPGGGAATDAMGNVAGGGDSA